MNNVKSHKKGQERKTNEAGKVKESTATRAAKVDAEKVNESPPERDEVLETMGYAPSKSERAYQEGLKAMKKCFGMSDEEPWYSCISLLVYNEKEKRFILVRSGSLTDEYWITTEHFHELEERELHKTARKKRKESRANSNALAQHLQDILDKKKQDGLEAYLGGEGQYIVEENDVFLLRSQDTSHVVVEKREMSSIEINWNAKEVDNLKRRIRMFRDAGMIKKSKDETSRFVIRAAQFVARAMDWYGMRMDEVFLAVDEEGRRMMNNEVVFSEGEMDDIFDREVNLSSPYSVYKEMLKEKWERLHERKRASEELRKLFLNSNE